MTGGSTPTAATGRDANADRLRHLLARRLDGDQAQQLELFARGLVGRGGGLLETLDDEAAAAMAWSSFQFYRGPGAWPRVRVSSPTYVDDAWDATVTLIETAITDRPFVVDTLQAALTARGMRVRALVHPIFAAVRDASGAVERLAVARDGDARESFVQIAVPRVTDPRVRRALADELTARLADVTLVTDDFPLLVARAQQIADDLDGLARAKASQRAVEATATAEFLRWLVDGAFVFLGYREYALTAPAGVPTLALRPGSGLGLLRREEAAALAAPRPLADLPERVREWFTGSSLLTMDRTVATSSVHRRERMDNIGVKEFDADGRVVGERRFLGLLTSQAHATESSEVPLLRRLLRQVLAAERVLTGSHDHKAFVEVFNTLPKGELFTAAVADVRDDIRTVLAARRSEDVVITIRERPQRATVVVIMPNARFSGTVRQSLDRLIEAHMGGQLLDDDLVVGDDQRTRLHYAFTPGLAPLGAAGEATLRLAISEVLRSWPERLADALTSAGLIVAPSRWADAFPRDYQTNVPPEQAVVDVGLVASATAAAPAILLDATTLKVVTVGTALVLADVLPILDGFGLRVLGEDTVTVHPPDDEPRFLQTFTVRDRQERALDSVAVSPRLVPALCAVLTGRAEADGLNRLVLDGGLDLTAVQCVRAYAGWGAQAGLATRTAIRTALTGTPVAAARLFDYLAARFRPGAVATDQRATFLHSLDAVTSLRDDAIFRGLLDAVDATVRTNAFHRQVEEVVAFKLRSGGVPWLPRPVPLFEAYVFGAQVEGVHLRAGRVARGGIRASDRPDDLRTEILALMKTQTEKNAVIVPTGAKGGFVVRGGGATKAAYRTFIAALLDLTDNVVGDRVVSPPGLLCYDEEDPYLVVAADKGTATFSDTANALAAERGFWLGDAFASGGSAGYDHKALGITARGAWECLRVHARSLGLDADQAPLRVVGIGDPSGDVFGNGMQLSSQMRLVAAFNHQHVFLDPTPDPARSAAERRRLFATGQSWAAYDRAQLSPGGMIVERHAKRVAVSAEVQVLLGLAADAVSGEALVRAALGADVDVLFNGGIGTYIKAARETHLAVGDTANDTVRVDADAVRARIILEGGNLGLTQAARVDLSLAGCRLNTDAIDNSAGVDCSDHEVNLKIGLAPLVAAGVIDRAARDALLADVTADVVARVLAHNRRQGRLLGLEVLRSRQRPDLIAMLQQDLERTAGLDRVAAGLPDADVLRARQASVPGYTRPELAVLVARTKIHLQTALLASPLPADPLVQPVLVAYFPAPVGARFPAAVTAHRLRQEITATGLANVCVDVMGATFASTLAAAASVCVVDVVRAWWVGWESGQGARLATALDDASLSGDAASAAAVEIERGFAAIAAWMLAHSDAAPATPAAVVRLADTLRRVRAGLLGWLTGSEATAYHRQVTEFEIAGLPSALAHEVVALAWVPTLLDLVDTATRAGATPDALAPGYFAWAEHIDFGWLLHALTAVDGTDAWVRRAAEGLAADVRAVRLTLAPLLPSQVSGALLDRVRATCRGLVPETIPSLAALAVVTHDLRRLAAAKRKGD